MLKFSKSSVVLFSRVGWGYVVASVLESGSGSGKHCGISVAVQGRLTTSGVSLCALLCFMYVYVYVGVCVFFPVGTCTGGRDRTVYCRRWFAKETRLRTRIPVRRWLLEELICVLVDERVCLFMSLEVCRCFRVGQQLYASRYCSFDMYLGG